MHSLLFVKILFSDIIFVELLSIAWKATGRFATAVSGPECWVQFCKDRIGTSKVLQGWESGSIQPPPETTNWCWGRNQG